MLDAASLSPPCTPARRRPLLPLPGAGFTDSQSRRAAALSDHDELHRAGLDATDGDLSRAATGCCRCCCYCGLRVSHSRCRRARRLWPGRRPAGCRHLGDLRDRPGWSYLPGGVGVSRVPSSPPRWCRVAGPLGRTDLTFSVRTSTGGHFFVRLSPGEYVLTVATTAVFPRCPPVGVPSGHGRQSAPISPAIPAFACRRGQPVSPGSDRAAVVGR